MSWINRESDHPFSRKMVWLFLAISIVLLIYLIYRGEIVDSGSNVVYYMYYAIALLAVLFWFFVLRLRSETQVNIVFLSSIIILGIYLIEGSLFFLGIGQTKTNKHIDLQTLGFDFDKRSKFEVVNDLIAKGIDAVPMTIARDGINDETLFPLAGISKKIVVGANESGKRMVYLTDRYGFRNPDSEWDVNELEWLLVGDSFAEGVAVQEGEDIGSQIRDLTQKSTINLGRAGNSPLMELATLTEYAGLVKPKKLLWIYYRNDLIEDIIRDEKNTFLMQYMEDEFSQNLINRQKDIDSSLLEFISDNNHLYPSKFFQDQSKKLRFKTNWIRLQSIRNLVNLDNPNFLDEEDVKNPLFSQVLIKAKERVSVWGGKIYFVYMPDYYRYNKKTSSESRFEKKDEVIDLVKGLGIPVIDIDQEVFANHSDPFSLFPLNFRHYNADGYRHVSRAIIKNINKYEQSN